MKDYVLAFPLAFPKDEIWPWLIQHGMIPTPPVGAELHLKGIPLSFQAHLKDSHPELLQIFAEHNPLSPEERAAIQSHQSILFLVGQIKDRAGFLATQATITSLLNAGALGVALEHCGAAFAKQAWLEESTEESLSGWLNWIIAKGDLRTFGLECFGLPDLVIQAKDAASADEKQVILLELAESQFLDEVPLMSGQRVEALDEQEYILRMEAKGPFAKGHPNYNAKGGMRLAKS